MPYDALDDELARILSKAGAAAPRAPRAPAPSSSLDDELESILTAGRAPTLGERAASLGSSVLHGIGTVVGLPKRGEDALIRASAKHLYGLDVPDDATSGELVRLGLGLDPTYNPEHSGYAGRALGKTAEFVTDVITDPSTPLLAGAGGAVQGGRLAGRVLARAGEDVAPELLEALSGAARTGARVAPAQKAAQAAFAATMGAGTVEEAAHAYAKAKEQGLSPETAEALLGTLASGYFATHVGRELTHGPSIDPFAEFNAVEARAEAERVPPERQPEPAPAARTPLDWASGPLYEEAFNRQNAKPLPRTDRDFTDLSQTETLRPVDVEAERAFLTPDRLAEFNAMRAREQRAEQQPLADAIRSMTDYETPAPRLGPKPPLLAGEGAEMVGLSPAAADAAGVQPTTLERPGLRPAPPVDSEAPRTTLDVTPETVEAQPVTAAAPDFKDWAEQKGFALTPETQPEALKQYVDEHPDATVDQRAEAKGGIGVPEQPAQLGNAAPPLVDGDKATAALDRAEVQPTAMPEPITVQEPFVDPRLPDSSTAEAPPVAAASPAGAGLPELGDRATERRQIAEPVSVDRRLAERRQRVAADLGMPEDSPAVLRTAQAEHDARTDQLTGLGNRRAFDEDMATHQGPVVSMDLGGLGYVNDNLGGHPAGDSFIRAATEAMADEPGIRAYRVGDKADEFALLADSAEVADAAAQNIQQRFANAEFSGLKDGKPVRYKGGRIDYGIGTEGHTAAERLAEGDRRLYESRQRAVEAGDRQSAKGSRPPGIREVAGPGDAPDQAGRAPETQLAAPSVDLSRVRRAFKGAEWREHEGGFHGRIGGMEVRVEPDATIHVRDIERGAAKASAQAAGGDGRPVGATYAPLDGRMLVKIAKGADANVIDHEALHVAMRLALSEGERKAVLRKYGWDGKGPTLDAEERAAEAYSRWTPEVANGAFARVMSFFRRVYRSFFPDAESVFAKVRGGDAFSREPKTAAAGGARFATAKNGIPRDGKAAEEKYAKAGEAVDGLKVRAEIPNQSSIDSSLNESEALSGVRVVPFSDFTEPKPKHPSARAVELAAQIKESGEINPLIVVIDNEGPYILEGANRFDALRVLGKDSFPAKVVIDAELAGAGESTKFATAPLPQEPAFEEGPGSPRNKTVEAVRDDSGEPITGKPGEFPINLERIGVDEDVKQALARLVKALPERMGEAKGYESQAETHRLALQSGLTPDQLIKLQKQHGALTARHIEAGRIMREEAAKDVHAKWEATKTAPDKLQAELDFAAAVTRAGAITAETVAAGAEAGRALAAHRMMSEGLRPGERFFQKIMRAHPALEPKTRDALLKAIASGDQRAIIAATQKAIKPSRMSKFLEAWKAGLVSGPPTLIGNAISNTVFEGWRTAERGVSGLVDALVSKARGTEQERFASESLAALNSLRTSFPQSLKLLANGLLDEQIKLGSKYEGQPGAIGGRLGEVVRAPFRVLQAFDDSAKHVAAQNELFAVAWRMAMREAQKGKIKDAGARATEIIDKAGKYAEARVQRDAGLTLDEAAQAALADREAGMLYAAMDKAAHEATFQDAVGKFTQVALDARHSANFLGLPLGDIVAPFMKTPSRILVQAAKRTPLGFIDAARVWKGIKEGTKTQGEFSEALAKPLMGTLLAAGFYAAAKRGDITGSGPSDDKKRRLLEATGWQPYSIKVGDSYYSFKRLEPLATVLGLAADMAEAGDEKQAGTIAEKLQGSLIQNITEKSWLTGITNLAQAWQDPKRYGAQWVRSLEGSLVPNIVRKAAVALDLKVRDTRSALGPIVSGIPGLSATLPARTAGTGEDVERPATGAERFLSPFTRSTEKPDARLERELLAIDYAPPEVGRTLHIPGSKARLELTDKEMGVLREADQRTTERLRKVVDGAGWRSLDGEQRKEYVERAYADARKAARLRLYGIPSVQRRAKDALRQARIEASA